MDLSSEAPRIGLMSERVPERECYNIKLRERNHNSTDKVDTNIVVMQSNT